MPDFQKTASENAAPGPQARRAPAKRAPRTRPGCRPSPTPRGRPQPRSAAAAQRHAPSSTTEGGKHIIIIIDYYYYYYAVFSVGEAACTRAHAAYRSRTEEVEVGGAAAPQQGPEAHGGRISFPSATSGEAPKGERRGGPRGAREGGGGGGRGRAAHHMPHGCTDQIKRRPQRRHRRR